MIEFYAAEFIKNTTGVNAVEAKLSGLRREALVRPDVLAYVYAHVMSLGTDCVMHKLNSVSRMCHRIAQALGGGGPVTAGQLMDDLKELRRRYEDEFHSVFLLHLEPKEADDFRDPLREWNEVCQRFPKIEYNIKETSQCFALERYGASVFFATLVAEYGVIKIAELMELKTDKPGWGSVQKLRDMLAVPYPQRLPLVKKHSKFLEDVVPMLIVIKDKWRHKLDHVDNQIVWIDTDFSEETAREIISSIRSFMRKLAQDLPKKP